FYSGQHRLIYAAIGALLTANKPADVITVYERLQSVGKGGESGGLPYLNALAQSVPSAANIPRYAEIVADRSAQRALAAACDRALAIALERGDAMDRLDRVLGVFDGLRKKAAKEAPRRLGE